MVASKNNKINGIAFQVHYCACRTSCNVVMAGAAKERSHSRRARRLTSGTTLRVEEANRQADSYRRAETSTNVQPTTEHRSR